MEINVTMEHQYCKKKNSIKEQQKKLYQMNHGWISITDQDRAAVVQSRYLLVDSMRSGALLQHCLQWYGRIHVMLWIHGLNLHWLTSMNLSKYQSLKTDLDSFCCIVLLTLPCFVYQLTRTNRVLAFWTAPGTRRSIQNDKVL
jgi:hypothetical protein